MSVHHIQRDYTKEFIHGQIPFVIAYLKIMNNCQNMQESVYVQVTCKILHIVCAVFGIYNQLHSLPYLSAVIFYVGLYRN